MSEENVVETPVDETPTEKVVEETTPVVEETPTEEVPAE